MAVYSMTGYASAQSSEPAAPADGEQRSSPRKRLGVEIRSVNSRFLDLAFRVPDALRGDEASLRERLVARLKRGKVEVRVSVEAGNEQHFDPAPRLLQRLGAAQDKVRSWLPAAAPLTVADVLRLAGSDQSPDEAAGAELMPVFEQALTDLLAARQREGDRLAAMLLDRTRQLRALARSAVPLVPQLVEQQRLRFLERWKDAMALAEGSTLPEAAQDRALSEATAFAIRIDVAEEITRLDSHLTEIERLLAKGGEAGKRLDFLIQELHREANTLGSKSAALELTRISVDMKVLIEQMREQVQNIE